MSIRDKKLPDLANAKHAPSQVLTERFDHSDFVDGGSDVGTVQFANAVPQGAEIVGVQAITPEGFAGDTSAAMSLGDGSDVDRYGTSTLDVFADAEDARHMGAVSGVRVLTADNKPTVTITVLADWGLVTAGIVIVSVRYYPPVI